MYFEVGDRVMAIFRGSIFEPGRIVAYSRGEYIAKSDKTGALKYFDPWNADQIKKAR